MASSCNVAVPNIKLSKFEFGRAKVGSLHQRSGLRVCTGTGQIQYAGVTMSRKTNQLSNICCSPSSGTELAKDAKSSVLTSQLIPNSSELESLVTEICNTDSIAEVELKLGGFQLYLMRDLTEKSGTPAPVEAYAPASASTPAPVPVNVNISAHASELNGSASSTSLAISKPTPPREGILSFLESAADEGLMILHSPRVGFFRRSRTIKGKRAPPSCKEKQIVKEGQVLCFIEQLGGELPIESDISGEVIRILREDGEPVGYGDDLIAILPSFPGIKKLQ